MGYAGTGQEGYGLRAGIGLKLKDFSFDYAYSGYGDLGLSHRYEVSMRFGAIVPRLTPEEREIYRRAKLAFLREDYSQATLLFDSLVVMEPKYKPFRRYVKASMNRFEQQEQARSFNKGDGLATVMYQRLSEDEETREIANLLAHTEEAATAAAPASAEENALAPLLNPGDLIRQPVEFAQ
jgi:hypothetical protein